jgi:hypothetical protein
MKKIFNYLKKIGSDEVIIRFLKKECIGVSVFNSDGKFLRVPNGIQEAMVEVGEKLIVDGQKLGTIRFLPETSSINTEIEF